MIIGDLSNVYGGALEVVGRIVVDLSGAEFGFHMIFSTYVVCLTYTL
jgi:hypothetical protein